jgi:hypothetical protein
MMIAQRLRKEVVMLGKRADKQKVVRVKTTGKVISLAEARRRKKAERLKDLDEADDKLEALFSGMLPLEDPGVTAFGEALADF